MAEADPDKLAFARFATAVSPHLGQIVFAGGWAHRLYLLDDRAKPMGFPPLMTTDADVATSAGAGQIKPSINELLLAAGFVEELSGDGSEPTAKYTLPGSESGFYAEFLVPVPRKIRNREPSATEEISGVIAQRLRHIDLLLMEPWSVELTAEKGYSVQPDGLMVRVANPACYLAQKLLVLSSRKPFDKGKDVLYIHDTIRMFGSSLANLKQLWQAIAPSVSLSTRRELDRLIDARFREPNDSIHRAAQIAARSGRLSPPSAGELSDVCLLGLRDIFGAS